MKPTVFLSHSTHDRRFIERLARDLMEARLQVWYAGWEIPVGESFRRRIFEEGIPGCDLFFVYLTPASVKSYWVEKELDAGFIRDAEARGGFMALFVDAEETRQLLSLDLRALVCPILNSRRYAVPLAQLVTRAWEGAMQRERADQELRHRNELLAVRNELLELQKQVAEAQSPEAVRTDAERAMGLLERTTYDIAGHTISLQDLFLAMSDLLATGAHPSQMSMVATDYLYPILGLTKTEPPGLEIYQQSRLAGTEVIGRLVISGLIREETVERGQIGAASVRQTLFYLTELGRGVAAMLRLSAN